jgi:hypothetical protein
MKKSLLSLFCLVAIISTNKAQNFHEIGIGFSGMRTWEVDPPKYLMQDLDYYWAPDISYQYYFFDEQISIRASVGLAREIAKKETILQNGKELREDERKSLFYQLSIGANLIRTKKSLLQINTGIRATRIYYYRRYTERRQGSSTRHGGRKLDRWYDPHYSLVTSISYQRTLLNNLRDRGSLSFRLSWDFAYQFPVLYGTVFGVENRFASIYTGPSLSLIWRIKQKRKRGLF